MDYKAILLVDGWQPGGKRLRSQQHFLQTSSVYLHRTTSAAESRPTARHISTLFFLSLSVVILELHYYIYNIMCCLYIYFSSKIRPSAVQF